MAGPNEMWPTPARAASAVAAALGSGARSACRSSGSWWPVTAGLTDDLRHDLNPGAVPIVGRGLLATLVDASAAAGAARGPGGRARLRGDRGRIVARLWPRLSPLPLTPARQAVLEAALVLSADHELAPSTLAARVAAAFRADPYAVVSTGLGPASGSWRSGSSGAPSEVERCWRRPSRAIRSGRSASGCAGRARCVHGFGMPLYPGGDPRGAELLPRLDEVDGRAAPRPSSSRSSASGGPCVSASERRPRPRGAVLLRRDDPGAGQAIATLGKVAGWLAHAMEEYASPTRFRTRARYIGVRPGEPGGQPRGRSGRGRAVLLLASPGRAGDLGRGWSG